MRRTLVIGGLLAVFAALLAQFGGSLGLEEIRSALLGAALGAALGIVPVHDGPAARAVGFLAGFVLAWVGYALRAGVLPDTGSGRAVAAFLVIAVLTGVCAATLNWLPFWSGLLGVAAIAGAYEYAFGIDPTAFTSESVTAATTVLLAAAVGYLVGAVAAAFVPEGGQPAAQRRGLPETLGGPPTKPAGTGEHAGVQILDKPAEA